MSDPQPLSRTAYVAVAALVSVLIRKQHSSSPEFLSMRSIIATTVDIIQSRPQSEGLVFYI